VQGFAVMVIHVWSSADHKRLFSFVVGVLAFDLAECLKGEGGFSGYSAMEATIVAQLQ